MKKKREYKTDGHIEKYFTDYAYLKEDMVH